MSSDPRAVARFVEAWAQQRGETLQQFADRAGLNASGLYQMARGERQYLHDTTLTKLAEGMRMSSAELLTAVGRGAADSDPDEVEFLALKRQIAMHAAQHDNWVARLLAVSRRAQPPPRAGRVQDNHLLLRFEQLLDDVDRGVRLAGARAREDSDLLNDQVDRQLEVLGDAQASHDFCFSTHSRSTRTT